MNKFLKQKNTAFTLVETLVAISIFTMSILGLMSILGSGISNTTYTKQKMTAIYLAQEGIEYARNNRDTAVLYNAGGAQVGWNTYTAIPLPKSISCPVSTCPVSSSDFAGFTRTITMASVPGTSDEVKITSTVTWTQGSGQKSITLSENLFNWIE
ncbi:MAG: prepilin-type N-terminal cleavage/methylation domain-containing protein, partial [Patescibacteria group bacterium]